MANHITKRQHYVWREFLGNWTDEESIPTLIKSKSKIITTNLMNVAQQRHFYKFNVYNKLEIAFLKHMCSTTNGPIKKLQEDMLEAVLMFNELKSIHKDAKIEDSHHLNILEKNGFEEFHTAIESQGRRLINCRSLKDLKLFSTHENKFEALMFLCFQYFRTKKQREQINKEFIGNRTDFDADNVFSFVVLILATKIAQNISFDKNISYTLLEINSDLEFITTDQPVINLLGDLKDENGNTLDMNFYYPIAPKFAIKIEFIEGRGLYNLINPTEEDVKTLNRKMYSESNDFVFAREESQLEQFINK